MSENLYKRLSYLTGEKFSGFDGHTDEQIAAAVRRATALYRGSQAPNASAALTELQHIADTLGTQAGRDAYYATHLEQILPDISPTSRPASLRNRASALWNQLKSPFTRKAAAEPSAADVGESLIAHEAPPASTPAASAPNAAAELPAMAATREPPRSPRGDFLRRPKKLSEGPAHIAESAASAAAATRVAKAKPLQIPVISSPPAAPSLSPSAAESLASARERAAAKAHEAERIAARDARSAAADAAREADLAARRANEQKMRAGFPERQAAARDRISALRHAAAEEAHNVKQTGVLAEEVAVPFSGHGNIAGSAVEASTIAEGEALAGSAKTSLRRALGKKFSGIIKRVRGIDSAGIAAAEHITDSAVEVAKTSVEVSAGTIAESVEPAAKTPFLQGAREATGKLGDRLKQSTASLWNGLKEKGASLGNLFKGARNEVKQIESQTAGLSTKTKWLVGGSVAAVAAVGYLISRAREQSMNEATQKNWASRAHTPLAGPQQR